MTSVPRIDNKFPGLQRGDWSRVGSVEGRAGGKGTMWLGDPGRQTVRSWRN